MAYEWKVTKSYMDSRSIYIPKEAQTTLVPGNTVTVLIAGDNDFSSEGRLSPQGHLSGMAALYNRLRLQPGATIKFETKGGDTTASIIVTEPSVQAGTAPPVAATTEANAQSGITKPYQTVLQRKAAAHKHFEPFRPQNLDTWDPENETDVYMAFGVLQEFTDYQYCCAASQRVLRALGIDYGKDAIPDAILIHRVTGDYLIAEWKKNSSDFKSNHKPEDVDVLVCWDDNETDESKLPNSVVELHAVAKIVLQKLANNDD